MESRRGKGTSCEHARMESRRKIRLLMASFVQEQTHFVQYLLAAACFSTLYLAILYWSATYLQRHEQ